MIKVIAFDLVGVLVKEKDNVLTNIEDKLERKFGPNINDLDYLNEAKEIIKDKVDIVDMTKRIINNLYQVKDGLLLKNVKERYNDIKIVVATNHLSYVKEFIDRHFGKYLDDIIISASIHKIKPNQDFYQYILDKYKIRPDELLFLDDNQENIDGALQIGINVIKVNKTMNLFDEVCNFIK